MKRTLKFGLAAVFVILLSMSAQATVYTMIPSPSSDMWNLGHQYYYTWGINWNNGVSADRIVNARLTFHNIYDWTVEDDDFLYTHLLDAAPMNAVAGYDGSAAGDFFTGPGYAGEETFVGVWSDPVGGVSTGFNLVYDFADLGLVDELQSYIANDNLFGFGFDADCHYYNRGISLEITTIPEPATMILLGLGIVGIGIVKRRLE